MTKTRVRFHDKHTGTSGTGVQLPAAVAEIATLWEDTEGDPDELVAEIESVVPDSEVKHYQPKGRAYGMVTLRIPAKGFPAHCWRVLSYDA